MALCLRSNSILQKHVDSQIVKIIQRFNRRSPQSQAQAVLLERTLENPVIVLKDNDKVDLIGPPDPQSNLRPILRRRLTDETLLHEKLRKFQDETQAWNQEFWAKHNNNFVKERKLYVQKYCKSLGEERTLTADEMSEFYKEFLDKNWEMHVKYNFEWYKKNFTMLYLCLCCNTQKFLGKLL